MEKITKSGKKTSEINKKKKKQKKKETDNVYITRELSVWCINKIIFNNLLMKERAGGDSQASSKNSYRQKDRLPFQNLIS